MRNLTDDEYSAAVKQLMSNLTPDTDGSEAVSENARSWDMGDPEPEGVNVVRDYTYDPGDGDSSWGRTTRGEWKSYKDGYKVYMDWTELVRRWGPVTEQ